MKKIFIIILFNITLIVNSYAATTTKFLESGTDATQDFSFFTSTFGTVTSDTAQHNTGPRSIKMATGAGPTAANATTGPILSDAGSQISFYVRFDTLPNAQTAFFSILATANLRWSAQLTTSGTIVSLPSQGTSATGSTVLAVNKWYRISISYYITNTTTYQLNVYVNGNLDSTINAGTLQGTGWTAIRPGPNATVGTNRNFWYDDIYVATGGASSSSQPDTGDIRVTAKRPFSNGTTNGYTTQIGSGGSGYGTGHAPQVNEQPLSTTNGWSMIGAGSAITEEYNIEGSTVGDVNIKPYRIIDYMGWVYSSSLAGETANIIVNGVSSNISLTSSNTMFTKAAGSTTYPAGTGTDIGEITSTTLTTVSLYEAGILIAYTPSNGDYFLVM